MRVGDSNVLNDFANLDAGSRIDFITMSFAAVVIALVFAWVFTRAARCPTCPRCRERNV